VDHLIVGLGNPEPAYEKTRHNLGFAVVKALAIKHGLRFRKEESLMGELARGNISSEKIFLLLPTTYMNRSGEAVRRTADDYNVSYEKILIVCDDAALPFGRLRLRAKGSSGGHNGLKNIEECLKTDLYPRLKIGIGHPDSDMADYVLGRFSPEEEKNLPRVIETSVEVLELYIAQEFEKATALASNFHLGTGEEGNVER
jgi:PTH1 family peptidyl-tRNA hydrolase